MVEIKTKWTEENLKEYAKYTTLFGGKFSKAMLIALIALYAVVVAGCIVLYFMFQIVFAIIMVICFTFFTAACVAFFVFTAKDFVKTALKSNENEEFDSVLINDEHIFICKDQQPIGELEWSKITKIYFNDKCGAIYLCTEENAILLLEYGNITSGTEEELRKTVREKYDKLSKKA